MSITVPVELGYEFEVRAKFAKVFALLSNVPESASHFPEVEELLDHGKGVYEWRMQSVGTPQVNLATVYACAYKSDKAKGTVRWTPVAGVGNAQVEGGWALVDHKTSTHITLSINADVTVALPALMKPVVAAVVKTEFERLVEAYIDNLIESFGGEVD
jgi:carbon monoxide dehydrogenase subunit G